MRPRHGRTLFRQARKLVLPAHIRRPFRCALLCLVLTGCGSDSLLPQGDVLPPDVDPRACLPDPRQKKITFRMTRDDVLQAIGPPKRKSAGAVETWFYSSGVADEFVAFGPERVVDWHFDKCTF